MKNQPFSIIYEDENIVAVNKASGIAVVGDRWAEDAPRLDKLLEEFRAGEIEDTGKKLFIVHRIDKDTSGLVVFAKNADAHKKLSAAFEAKSAGEGGIEKTYIAIIYGRPEWKETVCELPLVPDGNKKHLTIIDNYRGKPSSTSFKVIMSAGNYTAVEAKPATGRTHQIRAHLAALGHPIACDPLYGRKGKNDKGIFLSSFKRGWRGDAFAERPLLARLGLHALKLEIHAQVTGTPLALEAPLPRDMAALLKQMKAQEQR